MANGSCMTPETTRNATIHIGRIHTNMVIRICFPEKQQYMNFNVRIGVI